MSKDVKQLETELLIRQKMDEERECSDRKYAIKLIETIVFSLVGLLAMAVVGALIKLVLIQ